MLKVIRPFVVADEGAGIVIDFGSLDTIIYQHDLFKAEIPFERLREGDGAYQISIDLEEVGRWDRPANEIISDKEYGIMYNSILKSLELLDIEGEINAG